MPNIRIKDIPTTASASSSTDFLALDGSANGTRKLNAYSPTFGGNLTVSGKVIGGNSSDSGAISTLRSAGAATGLANVKTSSALTVVDNTTANTDSAMVFGVNGSGAYIQGLYTTVASTITLQPYGGSVSTGGNLTVSGGTITSGTATLTLNSSANTVVLQSAGTTALTLDASQNATFAKNLTVKGSDGITLDDGGVTAILRLAGGGNELLQIFGNTAAVTTVQIGPHGATSALQLTSTTATVAGNLTVSGSSSANVNIAAFRSNYTGGASTPYISIFGFQGETTGARIVGDVNGAADNGVGLKIQTRTNAGVLQDVISFPKNTNNTTISGNLTVSGGTVTSGTGTLTLNSSANTVVLQSAGTTALTLDSSQNATFAGTVTIPKCIAAGSAGLSSTRFGIYFGGTLSGSTDQIAIVSAPTFDSSAVSLAAAGYFAPATANSSFTAGAVYGLYVASTQKGAASTITTNYGLRIFDQASGATNYAIYTGSGLVRVGDTTASTSTSTGALTVSGGIGVAGAANFGGAIAIGNTVNTVSPTSPNRTITMVIGGTTYYLAAKTTND